jgi:hypothetical protein
MIKKAIPVTADNQDFGIVGVKTGYSRKYCNTLADWNQKVFS